jgi:hypothetical protein
MANSLNAASQAVAAIMRATQRVLGAINDDASHLAYLNEAADRVDLEMRIRELDRPRQALAGYPTNFSMH